MALGNLERLSPVAVRRRIRTHRTAGRREHVSASVSQDGQAHRPCRAVALAKAEAHFSYAAHFTSPTGKSLVRHYP